MPAMFSQDPSHPIRFRQVGGETDAVAMRLRFFDMGEEFYLANLPTWERGVSISRAEHDYVSSIERAGESVGLPQ